MVLQIYSRRLFKKKVSVKHPNYWVQWQLSIGQREMAENSQRI
jgi:hypothetical protein